LYELHFACSDYSDPLRNSYSYRIKELEDNWISLEDRHTLNVGGIPYGSYTLEVKAINSRGASSENILLFHIVVTQPFYKTWWFFALILTGIAIIFYAAYLLKYQSFKNILYLRMKIASNLHDEVGSLLTRITMFSDNLRYSKNNEEQRNTKLEKIAALSRDAVTSMSDVLWAIDSRNDFAGNLLDRMREHTEEMLFPLGIDVNFVLSGTDLKQPISSDMRGEIYLIFKEAINNIAKHSEATKVDILYQVNDKSFLLNITNNGAKEDISELSTGQGLSNMKMRAAKTGAKIQVKKEGETFSVEIKN
jgi:nitrate/nitrite-specific signal transduction histidine kinase